VVGLICQPSTGSAWAAIGDKTIPRLPNRARAIGVERLLRAGLNVAVCKGRRCDRGGCFFMTTINRPDTRTHDTRLVNRIVAEK
jgi:hypothetical protein